MTEETAYVAGEDTDASPMKLTLEQLRKHCAGVLIAAGLRRSAAELVADSLVDAEARGIGSHGVARTRIYAERLKAGLLDGEAEPNVIRDDVASIHLDAQNAIGHVGADVGMALATRRAEEGTVGVVGVSNSNHCGTLAYFTRRAARRGLVAIAMSTAPVTMVYHGGKTRSVGTNPVSFAVPASSGPPIVVDMATSATARGKIILANQLGQDIPEGWAVDINGRPTTNAAAALAGSVTPFAGPKGSGLAMMVDLLAGAMVGGVSGDEIGDMYEDWTRPQRVGHLFIAMNPDGWLGKDAFRRYVDVFADRIHDLPAAEGFERVMLPGELEHLALERAEREGVVLSANVFGDLKAVATEMGFRAELTGIPVRAA